MLRISLIVTALFALVIAPMAPFVSAQTGSNSGDIQILNKEITERKQKIKELEETIAKYNSEIKKKQTEAVSLKNQLSLLDSRVNQLNADIELTKQKILQTELEIQQLTLSIGDKNSTIGKQKMIISQMIKQIYAADQKNYFEIMLTYDNFSEFYDEIRATEDIYVDLGRSVKTVRLAKEDLEARKDLIEEKRVALAGLNKDYEDKKTKLSSQAGAKQNLLTQTKSSEAKYQTLLSSLKKQYQVIEGEIRAYEDQVRKRLEKEDKIKSNGAVLLSWPTPSRYVTSYFYDPNYPYKNVFEHNAIDIRAAQGTPIRAAASGYVGRARTCTLSSCYAYVLLIHTGEISTVYGHLSKILVKADEFVNRGDIIGYSGGTPRTVGAGPFVTGPHLHFEVRLNGIPVNPLGYLD